MRSRYKIIEEKCIYFITSIPIFIGIEWIPVFTSEPYFKIIIESLRFCQKNKALKIFVYVIMDNHFHLIVSGEKLSDIISSLKKHTAKKIIEQLQSDKKLWLLNQLKYYKKKYKKYSTYQIWQEGFHPQLISSIEMLDQKIEYVHFNPVKRGFVTSPEDWKYSSANNRDLNGETILKIDELPELF